jgi:uncharacterized protein YbjT (DUF2867 family)
MSTPGQESIVVTGATGFTGPFVVRALTRQFPSARVCCFVRARSDRRQLKGLAVEFAEGDLQDTDSVVAALKDADTLVNVASLGFSWVDPLFDAISQSPLRRGVFMSTTAILTKLPVRSRPLREHGERRVQESGLAWTIVRPTMIYGTAGDRNISRLIRFIERSPVIPLIASAALQQPVHVEDVASAIASCLAAPQTIGRIYNLSGRDPISFETLIRETVRATGRRRLLVQVPAALMHRGVQLYAAVAANPRLSVEQVLRLQEDKAFDHTAARKDFGFSPRSFAEGVRDEVRSMTGHAEDRQDG